MENFLHKKRLEHVFESGGLATFESCAGSVLTCKDKIIYRDEEAVLSLCKEMGI